MSMQAGWLEEFWRLVIVLILSMVPGFLLGEVAWVLFAGLLIYVLYNLYNLQRFNRWISNPNAVDMPVHFGLWGGIYAQIARYRHNQSQQKKQLAVRLQQFEKSAAALPDAVIALGSQGEIRWFNQAARDLFLLRKAQDTGQPFINLFRNPKLIRFLASRDFNRAIEIVSPGNGQRNLSIRITPYGEGLMLLLAQDITERYRAEQVRKDFVANVSHELRTPLTVISGFIENMQMEENSDCIKQWQKPLALMEQQALRMQHIVEDLLLLARLDGSTEEAPLNPIHIKDMCEAMLLEAQALAADKLDIALHISSQRDILGDATQLRSAFTNLIANAVNYTPEGGNIRITWQDEGTGSILAVEDDGEGIAPQHVGRLTERFYRVDAGRSRENGGTGLGLAIVKHILQVHGANLEINSIVGKGSRFICRFPAKRLNGQH
jgi:two-component system phosphate regulon sensor histidine kinase PhoR